MSASSSALAIPAPARFTACTLIRGAGADRLQRVERVAGSLGARDVRVRIHAVALNHRDLMLADGRAGPADRAIVPASDAAGEVVAIGPEVETLAVGDRVVSSFFPDWLSGPMTDRVTARALGGTLDGVLAEQVVLPESAWVPMPAHLDYIEASTLSCAGVTAWHALFGLDPLPPGATIALLGTGGVSIWALQLARAAGHRVLVTSSDDDKLARVRALGADATVNYRQTPDWGAALRTLSGGHGVDRVLDIGGPDTITQSIRALRSGGTVAVIGRLTGSEPARLDPAELFIGGKRLVGLSIGSRAMALELARFVEQSGLRPVVDRVFGYRDAGAAFHYLAAGRHIGKVVIDVSGEAA